MRVPPSLGISRVTERRIVPFGAELVGMCICRHASTRSVGVEGSVRGGGGGGSTSASQTPQAQRD